MILVIVIVCLVVVGFIVVISVPTILWGISSYKKDAKRIIEGEPASEKKINNTITFMEKFCEKDEEAKLLVDQLRIIRDNKKSTAPSH